MRTNIDIDDALMRQAMKVSQAEIKTKRAVVEEALRMLVRIRAQEDLRSLIGKVEFSDGYDYKAMRAGDFDHISGKTDSPNRSANPSSRRLTSGVRSRRRRAA